MFGRIGWNQSPCIWMMGLAVVISLSKFHSLMERNRLGASIDDRINCWSLDRVKLRHALYMLRVVVSYLFFHEFVE